MTTNFSLLYGGRGAGQLSEAQQAEFDRLMSEADQQSAEIERAMQQAMQPMDQAIQRAREALFDPDNNPMTQGSDLFQIEYTYQTKVPKEEEKTPPKVEEAPQPDRFARILKDDDD